MPVKKGNSISLTEQEAKEMMKDLNLNTPKTTKNATHTPQKQGKGWWNDPIRHSLASKGIQTVMNKKGKFDDYGSVFFPSDRYKETFKEIYKKIDYDGLKESLKEIFNDPEKYNDFEDILATNLEDIIGSIEYRYQSQKDRGQLQNGNFRIDEDDYLKLKKLKKVIEKDDKEIDMWVSDLETDFEEKKSNAREKLNKVSEELKSKTDDQKKYRIKIGQKLEEYTSTLNQYRADVKYAKQIKNILDKQKNRVKELYGKAMKEK